MSPARADELRPFDASYAWRWHGITVANSIVTLARQGSIWTYTARSEPRGIGRVYSERPVQTTTLQMTGSGIRPLRYDVEDGTSSTRHDAHVVFDWERQRATGVAEDIPVDIALQPGAQNDLSVQIALMNDLLAGRSPEQFILIDKNSELIYRYSREATTLLRTAIGDEQTVIYSSQKNGSKRITRFWCAVARGYIPVQVEQSIGDDIQWSMQIQSLHRQ